MEQITCTYKKKEMSVWYLHVTERKDEGLKKVKRGKKRIKLFQSIIIIISRRVFSIGFPWKREKRMSSMDIFFSSRERDKRGVNLFSDCFNRWKRERMVLCITGKRKSAVEVLLFVFFTFAE